LEYKNFARKYGEEKREGETMNKPIVTITISNLKLPGDIEYIRDLIKEAGFTIDTLSVWEGDD